MASTGKKTVLSDRFLIGEELGRGAYGQVYKGIDYTTGDTVAIKQISLAGISQDNLQNVMGEIELLKTLNHKNIVKYFGSFKTRTHLYIILEFMENGSLASIIKPNKFGTFPEGLVAVYIAQVLHGLQYLHEQGVVHRDIKGANILTTKDGLVKLADFGVAAKLGELEAHPDELQQNVVGTPYWMAPEVIEMTQVTSSSDIWSVGCLIIELLTGYPPYYDLQPMSALFRIVQDDRPPLPEGISPLLYDFLCQCFQKDSKLRPDARTLLHHEWLQYNRRTLKMSWRKNQGETFRTLVSGRGVSGASKSTQDAHETVQSVVARIMAAGDDEDAGGRPRPAAGAAAAPGALPRPAQAAAGSSRYQDTAMMGGRSSDGSSPQRQQRGADELSPLLKTAAAEEASNGAAKEAYMPGPVLPSPTHAAAGLAPAVVGPTAAALSAQLPADSAAGGPAAGSTLGGLIQRLQGEAAGPPHPALAADNMPGSSLRMSSAHGPSGHDLAAWMESGGSAYDSLRHQQRPSDMGAAAGSGLFDGAAPSQVVGHSFSSDPTGASQAGERRRAVRELVRNLRPGSRDPTAASSARVAATLEALISGSALPSMDGSVASAAAAAAGEPIPPAEAKALFIAEGGVLVLMELLDTDNQKAVEASLDLLSALTRDDLRLLESLCLVGLVPVVGRFTQQPWPVGLRIKAAAFVHQLCFRRDTTLQVLIACGGMKLLVGMVADSVASEPSPLSHMAIQCLLQVLHTYTTLPLNYMCRILAQSGLVPRLFKLLKEILSVKRKQPHGAGPPSAAAAAAAPPPGAASPRAAPAIKHAHSHTVSNAASPPPPAPASAAGGTPSRALTLPAHLAAPSVSGAVIGSGAGHVPGPSLTPEEVDYLLDKAVCLLSVLSNADGVVKATMATRDNLLSHLDCLVKTQPPHLVELLRCLRNLTSEPAVMAAIKDAGAISCLVPFLAGAAAAGAGAVPPPPSVPVPASAVLPRSEVQMEALNALYNLCMFNKKVHLEAAAAAGIVPHLCTFAAHGCAAAAELQRIRGGGAAAAAANGAAAAAGAGAPAGSPAAIAAAAAQWPMVRSFVVPMLIGMVLVSANTRGKLWANHGLDIFLLLLSDEDSRSVLGVLQAIDCWLAEDHSRVEAKLTQRDAVKPLVDLYARSCTAQDMQSKLETLRQMLGRSSKLAVAMAQGGLVPPLISMIEHAAPINRVKILDIVRILYEHYPRPKEFIMMYKIHDVLSFLLKTHGRDADAVIQQAQRLLSAFDINVLL